MLLPHQPPTLKFAGGPGPTGMERLCQGPSLGPPRSGACLAPLLTLPPTQSLLFSVSHSAGQSPLEGEPLCAILAPGRRRPVQPLCQPPARHSCYDFVQLTLVKRSTGCWMVSRVQQQTTRANETGEFITRRGGQAGRQRELASGSTGQCFGVPALGRIGQFKPQEWGFGPPWGSHLRGAWGRQAREGGRCGSPGCWEGPSGGCTGL